MNNNKNEKPQPQGQTKKHILTQIIVCCTTVAAIIILVLVTPATPAEITKHHIDHYGTVPAAVLGITFPNHHELVQFIVKVAESIAKEHIDPSLYYTVPVAVLFPDFANNHLLVPFPVILAVSIAKHIIT